MSSIFYLHLSYDFLRGKFVMKEEEILTMASLKMCVDHGDFTGEKSKFLKINIEDYIPVNLIDNYSPQIWIDKIFVEYLQFNSFSRNKAKLQFLEYLTKTSELSFSHQFEVNQIMSQNIVKEKIIAIKKNWFLICEIEKKNILEKIPLEKILKWTFLSLKRISISIVVNNENVKKLEFETEQAFDIDYLLKFHVQEQNVEI